MAAESPESSVTLASGVGQAHVHTAILPLQNATEVQPAAHAHGGPSHIVGLPVSPDATPASWLVGGASGAATSDAGALPGEASLAAASARGCATAPAVCPPHAAAKHANNQTSGSFIGPREDKSSVKAET